MISLWICDINFEFQLSATLTNSYMTNNTLKAHLGFGSYYNNNYSKRSQKFCELCRTNIHIHVFAFVLASVFHFAVA